MNGFAYIIINVATILIWALQAAMFLRAILSWFPGLDDNKFGDFLYTLTEPVIAPVRALLYRFRLFQEMPIDMSFLFAYLLLSIISMILRHI